MEQHRNKIEEFGSIMEKMGYTPVAARVFVYLMLCKEEDSTFEALVDYFRVSKSAVSNALKMLEATQAIASKTVGGSRKRYFKVSFDLWVNKDSLTEKFKIISDMFDEVYQLRNSDDETSLKIKHISLFYKMMIFEFPIISERWKKIVEGN
jgi:DNA-binding transcriptional regulator GbsR (MarR family)